MTTKIDNLRKFFKKHNIDAYIVPSSDEYQNEYTPSYAKRLEYITGFTGSNGYVIITQDKVYFFTDGRYTLQAKKELPDFFEILDYRTLPEFTLEGLKIGYNPMIFTAKQANNLLLNLALVPVENDLIDAIWENKPAKPGTKAYIYEIEYAGSRASDKILKIRKQIENKADYVLISNPDSVGWALNIRASDIDFCPIMLATMLVSKDTVELFTDLSRISEEVKQQLNFVNFYPEHELPRRLIKIEDKIMIDPASCSICIANLIKNKVENTNPCQLFQSRKNNIEIAQAIEGHIKDAVALCEAFTWIVAQHENGNVITEYEVGQKLSYFRSKQDGYVMDSFPPIVGFNDNGAVIHYKADKLTAKKIEGDGVLLIDSGGHYLGATTDVTRNLVFGNPSNELKKRYTQVLKGHINLAKQHFPEGTAGSHLDSLARMFLWEDNLDYAHGTGHGVGNFLSVHEYSVISRYPTSPSIKAGTILSNEPGFYKNGEYGIRIENLLFVKDVIPAPDVMPAKGGIQAYNTGFLCFENLTLMPYCHKLIDFALINKSELEYLSTYYAIIKSKIRPYLSEDAKKWLDGELSVC